MIFVRISPAVEVFFRLIFASVCMLALFYSQLTADADLDDLRQFRNLTQATVAVNSALADDSKKLKRTRKPVTKIRLWRATCRDALKVSFFGDVFVAENRDRPDLFSDVQPLLKWGHANVVNFEGTFSNGAARAFPTYPFALTQSPEVLPLLLKAGVKFVVRANNHAMDYGIEGYEETNLRLQQSGIAWAGIGDSADKAWEPLVISRNKRSIAVIASTTTYPSEAWARSKQPGVAHATEERLRQTIRALKEKFDFIVTIFHWGKESSAELRGHQISLARVAIDEGADLVVGHHAHIAQGIEKYRGKTIAYGLGNFIFTSRSERSRLSLGLHAEFCGTRHAQNRRMSIVLSPLNTNYADTDFVTTLFERDDLAKEIRYLSDHDRIAPSTRFFVPGGNRIMRVKEILGR